MSRSTANIPKSPGIYEFFDKNDRIIYIGKAKSLKNRVSSYFSKSAELSPAKQTMVSEIADIRCAVVNKEREAILLEAALIKKHQPKYNIVLRDDKNWSYIVITHEKTPRLMTIRGTDRIRGEYFGPYTNGKVAKTIVRLIYRILPIHGFGRSYSTVPRDLLSMADYLGLTNAARDPRAAYASVIAQARTILKGDTGTLLGALRAAMNTSATREEYEKARLFRDKIAALERIREPQDVVHPLLANQDVIGIACEGAVCAVSVMQFRGGQMLDTIHAHLINKLRREPAHVLEQFIVQYYGRVADTPAYAVLPYKISTDASKTLKPLAIVYPQRGSKKRLLTLAEKNAFLELQKIKSSKTLPHALYQLKKILDLPHIPRRIEVYDISNIVGTSAVGAMVVTLDGVRAPSHYRKFRIKTVIGANDVAMMKEVLMRRQNHTEWPDPDLIILDGGKPQLNTVYPVLKPAWKERVAALAKQEEELFVPGRHSPIRLPKNDPALLLLRAARNEVHRTAISYFRLLHRKKQRSSPGK